MTYANETWKPVAGFEGSYEVSTHGNVRSLSRQTKAKGNGIRTIQARILKPGMYTGGYLGITLHANGERREATIHRLVAEAFLDTRPSALHEVNHINALKTDNRIDNLEWVTRQANIAHNVALGINLHGEALPQSKLTDADVVKIRQRAAKGESYADIAREYGMSRNTIGEMMRGKTWKHVPLADEKRCAHDR